MPATIASIVTLAIDERLRIVWEAVGDIETVWDWWLEEWLPEASRPEMGA